MYYIAITDRVSGEQASGIFESWADISAATSNPLNRIDAFIKFKITGKNYAERRNSLEEIAQKWQSEQRPSLSYGEAAQVDYWLQKQARRYGLVKIFEQEGII